MRQEKRTIQVASGIAVSSAWAVPEGYPGAEHPFKLPKSSGKSRRDIGAIIASWITKTGPARSGPNG